MTSATPNIASVDPLSLRLLLPPGEPECAGPGGSDSTIADASLDDAGTMAWSADLSEPGVASALFLQSENGTRTLLQAGEAAPGGGRYKRFSELDIASCSTKDGDLELLLFRAELEGCSSREGLFLWTRDSIRVIALAGTVAPRGGIFQSFARPSLVAVGARSGPGFVLAYEASMRSAARSVIVHPSYAPPVETLAIGDLLGEDEVQEFSLSRMAGCLGCAARLRGKSGQPRNQLVFVKHGLTLHGGGLQEGARFPSQGRVDRIIGAPTVSLQTAFAAIEFAGGASALVASDVVGNAQVFARSGDLEIGLSGDPIASFGPPVSNAAFPVLGRFGVAAPVRLQSGRNALWSAVFSEVLPLKGEQRLLPLQSGNAIPIKLTNRGALLLRLSSQQGPERWIKLEGLFEPMA
jgi:hypothetical protein